MEVKVDDCRQRVQLLEARLKGNEAHNLAQEVEALTREIGEF